MLPYYPFIIDFRKDRNLKSGVRSQNDGTGELPVGYLYNGQSIRIMVIIVIIIISLLGLWVSGWLHT